MSDWYAAVSELPLQQGDFLRDLNIYVQDSPDKSDDPEQIVEAPLEPIPLAVIVSQSCDLTPQPGEEYGLLCPVRTMAEVSRVIGKGQAERIWKRARENLALHYFALPESSVAGWELPVSLVDFRRVFEVRIERLQELCVARAPWLRLLPPYRELMAQQFARKIMRVALVNDDRPLWDEFRASLPEKQVIHSADADSGDEE